MRFRLCTSEERRRAHIATSEERTIEEECRFRNETERDLKAATTQVSAQSTEIALRSVTSSESLKRDLKRPQKRERAKFDTFETPWIPNRHIPPLTDDRMCRPTSSRPAPSITPFLSKGLESDPVPKLCRSSPRSVGGSCRAHRQVIGIHSTSPFSLTDA